MKLSQLTQSDKIKLASELAGWEPLPEGHFHPDNPVGQSPPRYATSYDAIIPLIQKQDEEVQRIIWNDAKFMTLTPSQLLDALLVATGKAEL